MVTRCFMSFRIPVALTLAALLLSACSMFESSATRAMRTTPDYRAGYSDGCASANRPTGTSVSRDDNAYKTNRAYSFGWNTGFQMCRTSFPTPGAGPFAEPTP